MKTTNIEKDDKISKIKERNVFFIIEIANLIRMIIIKK